MAGAGETIQARRQLEGAPAKVHHIPLPCALLFPVEPSATAPPTPPRTLDSAPSESELHVALYGTLRSRWERFGERRSQERAHGSASHTPSPSGRALDWVPVAKGPAISSGVAEHSIAHGFLSPPTCMVDSPLTLQSSPSHFALPSPLLFLRRASLPSTLPAPSTLLLPNTHSPLLSPSGSQGDPTKKRRRQSTDLESVLQSFEIVLGCRMESWSRMDQLCRPRPASVAPSDLQDRDPKRPR